MRMPADRVRPGDRIEFQGRTVRVTEFRSTSDWVWITIDLAEGVARPIPFTVRVDTAEVLTVVEVP